MEAWKLLEAPLVPALCAAPMSQIRYCPWQEAGTAASIQVCLSVCLAAGFPQKKSSTFPTPSKKKTKKQVMMSKRKKEKAKTYITHTQTRVCECVWTVSAQQGWIWAFHQGLNNPLRPVRSVPTQQLIMGIS